MSRSFYELRRLRPHGLDSEELGTYSTEAQARAAMASWRNDTAKFKWRFRISLITVEIVHDDAVPRPDEPALSKAYLSGKSPQSAWPFAQDESE